MTVNEKLEVYDVINQKDFLEYSDLIDYIADNEKYGHYLFNNATSEVNVPWIVEYLNSRKRVAKERKSLDDAEPKVEQKKESVERENSIHAIQDNTDYAEI